MTRKAPKKQKAKPAKKPVEVKSEPVFEVALPAGSEMTEEKLQALISTLSPEALDLLRSEIRLKLAASLSRKKIWTYYPDEGPLRRELYQKHLEFFAASTTHNEIAFIGANRSGKTHTVCYACVLHMLGKYPDWWVGRRFNRPVSVWASGVDAKSVRESLQPTLFGEPGEWGTGLVPGDNILNITRLGGVPDAIDTATIRSELGGVSSLTFKNYAQGRESFQAAKVDIVLLDEEPPQSIYSEALTRTMSTVPGQPNGLVMAAFTPLKGWSEVVMAFLGQQRETET